MMIDTTLIPEWWAVCQYKACGRAGECLRYLAYQSMPKEVTAWRCVLPRMDGGECGQFQKAEKVRLARGFKKLFDNMYSRDARHGIRMELTEYFGSKGSYYRYRDGERQLSPEQQRRVADVLRRYGMDATDCFDEYATDYDFRI